jgi:uncharacterized membrane protein
MAMNTPMAALLIVISLRSRRQPVRTTDPKLGERESAMRLLRASCLATMTFVLLFGGVSSALAVPYAFTTIDVPAQLGTSTNLQDINDAGNIVGWFVDPAVGRRRGVLVSGGTFTVLDAPGVSPPTPPDVRTSPTNLNNVGQIVGFFRDATVDQPGFEHGFLRQPAGTFTTINAPGAVSTNANGINDLGAIAGVFRDAAGVDHGFLRQPDGTFTPINVPGAASTSANDINNNGLLVGFSTDAMGAETPYLRNLNGSFSPIIVPGATTGEALGINTLGQITGFFEDTMGVDHGFLRDPDGTFTTLDPPGSTLTFAVGINGRSQIVGVFLDSSGVQHGFLATPAPEPGSLLLLASGLAAVSGVAWRRHRRK